MTTSGASSLRPPPRATIDRQSLARFEERKKREREKAKRKEEQ